MEQEIFKRVSIFVAIGLLAALTVLILWPIATAIITGLLLAYIFYPVYKKIFSVIKERNVSALIVVLSIVLLICIPLWYLLPLIVKQVFDLYLYLQNFNLLEFLREAFPSLTQIEFTLDFANSFNSFISDMAGSFFSGASNLILNLPNLLLKAAVVFVVFFFGMRDGQTFLNYGKSLSPFSKQAEGKLSEEFKGITHSVIYGFIIVGIIQGVLTGIGLAIAGVSQALLLTIVAIVAAIIPILGSWIIWVPAAIYLLVNGNWVAGIFLVIYGSIIISWIDNIIRPYLVARRIKISSAIVLVGMIGGFLVFGILGFIIGPLVLAYLLLILDAYRNENFPSLFTTKEPKTSFDLLSKLTGR